MQATVEKIIHEYLQEKGYDSYISEEYVAELATRIIAALPKNQKSDQ